ncbi:MAG: tyrosine--tRNA ligase, partial [Owenweeksia sp.]
AGVPQHEVESRRVKQEIPIVEFLAEETSIFPSKGEARKMVQGNGISINKTKVDLGKNISETDLVNDKYILVQRGKRNYFLILCN